MASLQESMRELLGADPVLAELVGADGIYPGEIPPDEAEFPLLYYAVPETNPIDELEGASFQRGLFEFHALADTYAEAKEVIDAVFAAFASYTGGQISEVHWLGTQEETTDEGYHHLARFDVWGAVANVFTSAGSYARIVTAGHTITLTAGTNSLVLNPDGWLMNGMAVLFASDLAPYARKDQANTFTAGPQTIQAGAAGNKALVLRAAGSATANLLELQDNSSNLVTEGKPFGRVVVNQISAGSPDNDLGGASTLLHLKQNGATRFAVFATGTFYITNSLDFANAATPCGIQYGNSKVQFLNGGGDIGITNRDASAFYVIRTGNPSVSAVHMVQAIQLNPTGTPGAGFGGALEFQLKSSTTDSRQAGRLSALWATATDASRKARVVLSAFDNAAEREVMRGETDGTNPMLGFLGAAAVTRPTVSGSRGGNAALASLLTALANLGLITDSTTA